MQGSIISKNTELKISLIYNDYNVIQDFSPYLQSITYHDFLEDECDELIISLLDKDKLFQNGWYPQKGAIITCTASNGKEYLNFGTFTIDAVNFEFNSSGDTLEIRAIAATNNLPVRTLRSDYYEKMSVVEIAKQIALMYGFDFYTNISLQDAALLIIERISQIRESDLGFLRRLSKEYGYIFKVTNNLLSFIKKVDEPALFSLNKADFKSLSFDDTSVKKYKGGIIEYFDPIKKKLLSVELGDLSGDILKLTHKFYSYAEGLALLKASLDSKTKEIQGSITLKQPMGNFIAGVNFNLKDFGVFNGKYKIKSTTHTISNGIWSVSGRIEKCDSTWL